jgi:ABC-type amino acid transport substrate-binding protein
MTRIFIAAALAALIATPAAAQPVKKKNTSTTSSTTWMTAQEKAYRTGYSPSGNPEWDVYVRGEYVGSDPDPRVRYTLRREAVRNYGFR